jgi:UDP-N-acetylmuramyl tripeptide synthase
VKYLITLLAAVATAWALGISHELIRAVIQTLEPGREEALQASQGNHGTR